MATAVRKLSRNNKSRSKRSGSSGGGASRAIGLLLALILVGGGVYAYYEPGNHRASQSHGRLGRTG